VEPKEPWTVLAWHHRRGHINPVALRKHLPDNIKFNPNMDKLVCDICSETKQKAKIVCTPQSRATTPFELIHSDICGPIKSSIGGAYYYLIYIDDFTRYVYIYFLATKTSAEIIIKFEHYNALVKKQGHRIKRFRCDHGTSEYANKVFWSILGQNGISFKPSPPYTQHKNGVSERMIQTLNTKACSMLNDAGLPMTFWAEALNTACYLHQHSPSPSLQNKTPFEMLYGRYHYWTIFIDLAVLFISSFPNNNGLRSWVHTHGHASS
jgi:transposase InsO family protein